MPWGIAAAVAAPVVGGLVSSATGPSSQAQGGGNSLYTPTGLGTADQSWQQLLAQELSAQQNIQGTQTGYGANYQSNANQAGAGYNWLAQSLLPQQAQQAYGTQQSLLNAGQQVYNTAFDPQNALFNQLSNQQQQQSGATNSMYGLGSSAAGAGLANQNQQNFDINWQNQQLQRQATGLQAYTGAAQAAGQYGQYGTQLQEQAPGYQLLAGQTPYSTGSQIAGAPISSAQSIQQGIIPYLNYGQGATSNAYNAASQSAGALGSAVSSGISGLGTATQNAGGLANLFSGTTGSFGGGNFSGAFNSSPYYSGGGNSYGFTM